ncbi:hypothetical protein [Pseudomonas sp. Ps21-P2]|uniref:hypothetical protein n=1 Tax=Pseudomonas sp. Ps21-P2 TaxID=3080331 RepID=UPI0032079C8B
MTVPKPPLSPLDFHAKQAKLFSDHLDGLRDDSTVVLKAHLLIEEMCRDFCSGAVANPAHLRNARFSFNHVVKLTRALCPMESGNFEYIWTVISQLTAMRNQLAHELEPDGLTFESHRISIIDSVSRRQAVGGSDEPAERLAGALSFVLGALSAWLAVSMAMLRDKESGLSPSEHVHELGLLSLPPDQ